jgi:protocatechuate 3,4-dioxygenase beta subunit
MVLPIVTLLAALAAIAGQFPVEDRRAASLSGRVVDAVTGRPIAGAIVTPAGSAVVISAAAPQPARALTNGDGLFVLRDLRKGAVFLMVAKNGYAGARFNQRRPGGTGQSIPIDDGQRVADVEIRMWKNSSISGTIVDEAGEPVVGVRVQAFPRRFVAGRRRFSGGPIAVTDDRGIYRIANLEPGDYAVGVPSTQTAVPTEVMDTFFGAGAVSDRRRTEISRELNAIGSAIVPAGSPYAIAMADQTFVLAPGTAVPLQQPGAAPAVYPTIFYPSAAAIGEATVVQVRSGDERGSVDLQLRPVRTARVTGIVMAPDGPAANVGVHLVAAGARDLAVPINTAVTLTNGSGAFTFPAVPPGQYTIEVLRLPREPVHTDHGSGISVTPGGTVTIGGNVPPAGPPPPPPIPLDATLWARLPLAVGEANLDGVIVPLGAGARVTGRVEFEGTGEKPSGSALTGIRINLDPADGSRLADTALAFQAGRPDEEGAFRTFGVPPGQYVLRANPPSGWTLKGAFFNGRDLSDMPFDIEAKDLAGVVLTFTDRPATLTGQVRNGQSVDPAAVVIAFPTDASAWIGRGPFPRRVRTARAGLDGTYTITALVPGEYYVAAVAEEGFSDWQDPALLEGLTRVARQVRVIDGERRTQDLTTAVVR